MLQQLCIVSTSISEKTYALAIVPSSLVSQRTGDSHVECQGRTSLLKMSGSTQAFALVLCMLCTPHVLACVRTRMASGPLPYLMSRAQLLA